MVGTVKKSIAAIASRRLRRNASQRLAGSGFLGALSSNGRPFARKLQIPAEAARHGCAALPRLGYQRPSGRLDRELAGKSVSFQSVHWPWKPASNTGETRLCDNGPCFRSDQYERLPPTRPQVPTNYPEESVEVSEAWARMAPRQHSQLLTQCQILKKETLSRAKKANQRCDSEFDMSKHGGQL